MFAQQSETRVSFTVKNTFIDDIGDETCVARESSSVEIKSCPIKTFRRLSEVLEIDDCAQVMLKCSDSIPDNCSDDSTDVSSGGTTPSSPADSLGSELAHSFGVLDELEEMELQAAKAGLDMRLFASRGAILHIAGNCKPCGWFYKPAGCHHGWECRHCHACPDGTMKKQRKERLRALKAKEREQMCGGE